MFKLIRNITIIFLVVLVAIVYEVFWVNKATKEDFLKAATNFQVEKGMTVNRLAEELESKGVIKSATAFKFASKFTDLGAKLQAGDYQFPQGASINDILEILVAGEGKQQEKTVLIKEGLTLTDMNQLLKDQAIITDDSFEKIIKAKVADLPESLKNYQAVKAIPADKTLEGFLFPDTYRLNKADGGEALVKKMLDNFESKLSSEMLAEIQRQGKTLYEVITMASIVEKEVRHKEDMKTVAGLFWKRITIGQRLESDATLSYALHDNTPGHTIAQTQLDIPYNTYRKDGLPPGPIANPGLKAIEATIYPTKTDYLFFLSRPDTGETIWAKTFEEHVRNKEKYLR